jgi:NAD(P)-dependent dehydrogenase (short-subunit alcohol dehydrogenase family)
MNDLDVPHPSDCTVVITGANSGVGAGAARRYRHLGHRSRGRPVAGEDRRCRR